MLKKRYGYILKIICGVIIIAVSFLLKGEELRSVAGVCIGVGAGLVGASISNLLMNSYEEKNPEIFKKKEIEIKDERNTMIRNRAKAKAADIIQWFIMAIAYITIIINSPIWVTLATVFVFLLYNLLGVYFMNKFQKEM